LGEEVSVGRWSSLAIPPFCERLIGFSVPVGDMSLAISYEAVHLLRLGESVSVDTDRNFAEYDIYDPETGTAEYAGTRFTIVGLHGGNPLLTTPYGARLELDQGRQTITVVTHGAVELAAQYENFSGDWASATFSPDGRHLLLGCPYDFDFRIWRRAE
jgi:hypothetical protein